MDYRVYTTLYNIQGMKKEYRQYLLPDKDNRFVIIDMMCAELSVTFKLLQDTENLSKIKDDFFTILAEKYNGDRQIIKEITYSIIYGKGDKELNIQYPKLVFYIRWLKLLREKAIQRLKTLGLYDWETQKYDIRGEKILVPLFKALNFHCQHKIATMMNTILSNATNTDLTPAIYIHDCIVFNVHKKHSIDDIDYMLDNLLEVYEEYHFDTKIYNLNKSWDDNNVKKQFII